MEQIYRGTSETVACIRPGLIQMYLVYAMHSHGVAVTKTNDNLHLGIANW